MKTGTRLLAVVDDLNSWCFCVFLCVDLNGKKLQKLILFTLKVYIYEVTQNKVLVCVLILKAF